MKDQTSPQAPLPEDFFNPGSIAFIGATPKQDKLGGRLFQYATGFGYTGKVYPVTPAYEEIGGHRCYASILDVKAPIDLAIIVIPAKRVPDAVEECAEAGVDTVMIISSGFAEEGGAALELQERVLATVERSGMKLIGPNSEGYLSFAGRVCATFSPVVEKINEDLFPHAAPDRKIGVISQSGGMGFAVYTRGRHLGLSFSHIISTGNEGGLTSADYVDVMVRDPETKVIVVLCEGIRDGVGFARSAARAREAGKPVIVCKLGRSAAGARAAASHTASLTGEHSAYRATFRRHGIVEAADMDELVALCAAFALMPLPAGRRVGIVTTSGGGGTMAADMLSDVGLTVPELSAETQEQILPMLPGHASALNPVDTTAQGSATGPVSMKIARILEASGEVDMLLHIVSAARENAVALEEDVLAEIMTRGKTPVMCWAYTLASNFARKTAADGKTVLMTDLRQVCQAMAKVTEYAELLAETPDSAEADGKALSRPDTSAGALTEHQAKAWLRDYGLGGEGDVLATSADAAEKAAEGMGYPVVMKVQSPDILHKTEVGGVRVGLADAAAVKAAYGEIVSNAAAKASGATVDGVLVQKMAPKGVELVVGMVNDATFGPIMMIGAGGTAVELFGDVIHYPAPISPATAKQLLGKLKSAPLWNGFRGGEPVDMGPAADLIARISQAALAASDHVAEMEFNPVIVHGDGSGLTVADAVVILKQ